MRLLKTILNLVGACLMVWLAHKWIMPKESMGVYVVLGLVAFHGLRLGDLEREVRGED